MDQKRYPYFDISDAMGITKIYLPQKNMTDFGKINSPEYCL